MFKAYSFYLLLHTILEFYYENVSVINRKHCILIIFCIIFEWTFATSTALLSFIQALAIVIIRININKQKSILKENITKIKFESKQRKMTYDNDEYILKLIDQGYFLYRKTFIGSLNEISLIYKNNKAQKILNNLECQDQTIAGYLVTVNEPRRQLRELLEESLNSEIQMGFISRFTFAPKISDQSIPFRYFNGEIWRLSKSVSVLILSEQLSENESLRLIEGFKDAIICTLSHELRTFTNGIIGNIELMIDNPNLGHEEKINREIALCSSYLLSNRLKDLFDHIQLQNNGFKLHYSEFTLDELLSIIKKVCGPYASQKQLDFIISKKGKNLNTIVGDKERLQQILMNLISKAIEFTDYGKIVLEMERRGNGLCFKVISYGSTMQHKLEQQINRMSPKYKEIFKEILKENTASIKNVDALSLEISQILCKEMGTKILTKNVKGKFSLLEFTIGDGFLTAHTNILKRSKTNLRFKNIEIHKTRLLEKIENKPELSRSMIKSRDNQIRNNENYEPLKIIQLNEIEPTVESDDIPNEIALTSPINLPSSKTKSLMGCFRPSYHSSSCIPSIECIKNFEKITALRRRSCVKRMNWLKINELSFSNFVAHSNMDDVAKMNVLIVDDDAINRRVLKALLKRFGYNAMEAKDGGEAISLIEGYIKSEKLYEVLIIFMDLQMPVMDGIMATKRILELAKEAEVNPPPIVGVTADPIESDRRNFIKAGLREILSKPVDTKKIEYIINKYIK